jgi:hypothetical protein
VSLVHVGVDPAVDDAGAPASQRALHGAARAARALIRATRERPSIRLLTRGRSSKCRSPRSTPAEKRTTAA